MSVKLLDMHVDIEADGKKAAQQAADDIGNSGAASTAGMNFGKRVVGAIAASVAVAKVGQFVGQSITEASDLNETISKSQAIFGQQAAGMEQWASTAATSMGLSKSAALAASASFGDMFSQIGFTGDAAASMSKEVVQAASDLGSFNNLETADVTERISAAFRGEYDSLQAVIPNINAARVEQEAMAASGKTTAASLTAQEKATAVMAIVTKDGSRAMGDFARTSDGFANQQKIAAAQTEDLKASIGASLLPVVAQLAGFLTGSVMPVLATVGEWMAANPAVVQILAAVIGVLALAFVGLTVATWAMNAALLANPITWIIIGIMALIAAVVLLVMNWDSVVSFVTSIWGGFVSWLTGIVNSVAAWWSNTWSMIALGARIVWAGIVAFVTAYINVVRSVIMTVVNTVRSWWTSTWSGISAAARAVWAGIVAFVTAYINTVRSVISSVVSAVVSIWRNGWNAVRSAVSSAASAVASIASGLASGVRSTISNVVGFFTGIRGTITGALSGAASWLVSTGRNIIEGLISGVQSVAGRIADAVLAPIRNSVEGVKNFLGIASPSRLMRDQVGRMIIEGGIVGVDRAAPRLQESMLAAYTPPSALGQQLAATTIERGAAASSQPASIVNNNKFEINEANDPLGTTGRIGRELRKFKVA